TTGSSWSSTDTTTCTSGSDCRTRTVVPMRPRASGNLCWAKGGPASTGRSRGRPQGKTGLPPLGGFQSEFSPRKLRLGLPFPPRKRAARHRQRSVPPLIQRTLFPRHWWSVTAAGLVVTLTGSSRAIAQTAPLPDLRPAVAVSFLDAADADGQQKKKK